MPTLTTSLADHIMLNVSWEGYVAIGEALRDQPIRMTYKRGSLEIMTLSREHEKAKKLLGRLVEALLEALGMAVDDGGCTTFHNEDLGQGLEADDCYWIQHAEDMRGKTEFNRDTDPPPDLALEVEVSRTILDRLEIYAGLGIPEIWCYDGESLRILVRSTRGQYEPATRSIALPTVPVQEIARFLDLRQSLLSSEIVSQFRTWLRQEAPGWTTSKPRRRKKS